MRRPACMDDGEWALWLDGHARIDTRRVSERVGSPCVDCHRAFADEMRAEGRCDGEPGADEAPTASERLRAIWAANSRAYRARKRAAA